MAVANDLVVNNGTADVTYTPVSKQDGVVDYVARVATKASSLWGTIRTGLTLNISPKKAKSHPKGCDVIQHLVKMPLERDVLDAAGATVKAVSGYAQASITYILPVTMTSTERTAFEKLVTNSQAAAQVKAQITDLNVLV